MTTRTLFCCATLICAVGCSGTDAAPGSSSDLSIARSKISQVPAAQVPAAELTTAVTANNAFAVDLYANALKATPSSNVLTSSVSATLALSMAYAGAQGQTKTEMAKALHFADSSDASVFAGQNALSQALNGRGAAALDAQTQRLVSAQATEPAPSAADYQLQVVNSVWGQKSYTWEAPFLDILAANYGTGVYQEDFVHASDPARVKINDWVSANTNDKINDLLPKGALDDTTRMVLVNAIHLKLPWENAFSASQTRTDTFTRADGSTVSAQFMTGGAFAYLDDGQAQIVSLPLSNRELSIVITLPHAGISLADYEASLGPSSAALSTPTSSQPVDLALPKATFTSQSISLSTALQTMGMKQAFDPDTANFRGLCAHTPDGQNLYVGDVLQKAMISMQETGVEAAAATAVALLGTASAPAPQPTPIPMIVNRPYLLAIVDNPTGAVLMLGQIQDPTDPGSP